MTAASWHGPTPGLCGACVAAKVVTSGRGSTFLLCERSRTDARFPRYPRLPVLACTGFELRTTDAADAADAPDATGSPEPAAAPDDAAGEHRSPPTALSSPELP